MKSKRIIKKADVPKEWVKEFEGIIKDSRLGLDLGDILFNKLQNAFEKAGLEEAAYRIMDVSVFPPVKIIMDTYVDSPYGCYFLDFGANIHFEETEELVKYYDDEEKVKDIINDIVRNDAEVRKAIEKIIKQGVAERFGSEDYLEEVGNIYPFDFEFDYDIEFKITAEFCIKETINYEGLLHDTIKDYLEMKVKANVFKEITAEVVKKGFSDYYPKNEIELIDTDYEREGDYCKGEAYILTYSETLVKKITKEEIESRKNRVKDFVYEKLKPIADGLKKEIIENLSIEAEDIDIDILFNIDVEDNIYLIIEYAFCIKIDVEIDNWAEVYSKGERIASILIKAAEDIIDKKKNVINIISDVLNKLEKEV